MAQFPGQAAGQKAGQPRSLDDQIARARLREWRAHLSKLDPLTPPEGFTVNRWAQLCDDAWWIYEEFASQLVREGWSAHDVFGVLPWHKAGGVLLDRLQGARNLTMEGPKAVWSQWGVADWTCSGAGDSLVSSGLKLIWELHYDETE